MNNIALMLGSIHIYWHGVLMAAAVAVSMITAFVLCSAFQNGRRDDLMNGILVSIPVGVICSRLLYISCNSEEFQSFGSLFMLSKGGYALYGVIFGVLISMLLMKKINPDFNAGAVSDCIAAGGALGIVIGRLSACFSGDNIGIVLKRDSLHFFPLTVYNEQKGEWVLATFSFEAFFELVIFVVLCLLFARNSNENKGMKGRPGDIALLFLLMHGCSQGVFDSMHVDALLVPGNSFVKVQQILGAVFLAVVTGIFVERSIKLNGFKPVHIVFPLVALGAIGISLYMELDRISYHNFIRNYSVIFASMLSAAVSGVIVYQTTLDNGRMK